MNPEDLLIGDDSGAVTAVKEFLGIQTEIFTCPDCNAACEESTTYNAATAAFDGGACPSWYCSECDTHYVRESDDDKHAVDLYGRE